MSDADIGDPLDEPTPPPGRVGALPLVTIGVVGQVLTYSLTVLLARTLPIQAFEVYVAAAALFFAMVAIAPGGGEKLALLTLPPRHRKRDWTGIRVFLRFMVRRAALGVAIIAGLGLVWAFAIGARDVSQMSLSGKAFLAALICLPVGVAAHLGLEVLTALGRAGTAAMLFRIGVPACAILGIAVASTLGLRLGGTGAVLIFGLAWGLVTVAMVIAFLGLRPQATSPATTPPEDGIGRRWARMARPLWAFRVGAAIMATAGVLALERFGQAPEVVGGYAAAVSIVGLMTVLVTSTNRAYARELAQLLAERDAAGIRALKRARLRWLIPVLAGLLGLVFAFSEALLGVFGPAFVAEGVWPLRILSVAAALSMALALIPTQLKYAGRNRLVLGGIACGASVQLLSLAVLVPPFGATGAATAFLIGVLGMHLCLALGRWGRRSP